MVNNKRKVGIYVFLGAATVIIFMIVLAIFIKFIITPPEDTTAVSAPIEEISYLESTYIQTYSEDKILRNIQNTGEYAYTVPSKVATSDGSVIYYQRLDNISNSIKPGETALFIEIIFEEANKQTYYQEKMDFRTDNANEVAYAVFEYNCSYFMYFEFERPINALDNIEICTYANDAVTDLTKLDGYNGTITMNIKNNGTNDAKLRLVLSEKGNLTSMEIDNKASTVYNWFGSDTTATLKFDYEILF